MSSNLVRRIIVVFSENEFKEIFSLGVNSKNWGSHSKRLGNTIRFL